MPENCKSFRTSILTTKTRRRKEQLLEDILGDLVPSW